MWLALSVLLGMLAAVIYKILIESMSPVFNSTRVMPSTSIAVIELTDPNVPAEACDWMWIYFPADEPEAREPFDILFTDLEGKPELKCYGVKKIAQVRVEEESGVAVWECSVLKRLYYK